MSAKLISWGTAGRKLSTDHSQIHLSHTYYLGNMEVLTAMSLLCGLFYFILFFLGKKKNQFLILAKTVKRSFMLLCFSQESKLWTAINYKPNTLGYKMLFCKMNECTPRFICASQDKSSLQISGFILFCTHTVNKCLTSFQMQNKQKKAANPLLSILKMHFATVRPCKGK